MKNTNLKIVLFILLVATLGCRLLMKQLKPDFFKADGAQKAAQAVKNKVGVPFKVQEVEITESTFTMKIETPGNTQNIDEYKYIGFTVVGPQPVQRDALTNSREKMPFDEIDFTVIPQIVKNALEKTQIEGGEVKRMTLEARDKQAFLWRIEITGTRESASAQANIAGEIVNVNLSQTSRAASYKILDETELSKASDAIKAKFGENARFEEIAIRETKIDLKVLNSDDPKKTDKYGFGIGGWMKFPLPLPANSIYEPFTLTSINLTDAVNLTQKAKQRLDLPDGQLNSIIIEKRRALAETDENSQLIWRISIVQGGNSGTVNYDAQLNEISVSKN